jgi:hypothetical protein
MKVKRVGRETFYEFLGHTYWFDRYYDCHTVVLKGNYLYMERSLRRLLYQLVFTWKREDYQVP